MKMVLNYCYVAFYADTKSGGDDMLVYFIGADASRWH